ncbi:hypothetical protein LK994_10940 [Ferruginibacter lapsinanis]|uniref:hypothetical protein n=1 Tax=Ferruginibacter lapsinanis TaxID=563172 RepID=UPI001E3DB079|nr:hypothetical protein [Ferruginibacter lapsinanis]UEG49147.1 hypothetical protein LK994_10940 [Ferruginibacter lapsinanis]
MRTIYSIFCLAILSIILPGCPSMYYLALEEPAERTVTIDTELLGTWRSQHYSEDSTEIVIEKLNKKQYRILSKVNTEGYGYTSSDFVGWISKVGNRSLMSLNESSSLIYYFAEWEIKHGALTVKLLSLPPADKYDHSAQLNEFISSSYSNKTMYYDEDTKMIDLKKIR